MDAALLACSDAHHLPVPGVAHGVALRVLESYGGHDQVPHCTLGQLSTINMVLGFVFVLQTVCYTFYRAKNLKATITDIHN